MVQTRQAIIREQNMFIPHKRNTGIPITGKKGQTKWEEIKGLEIHGSKVLGKNFQGKYQIGSIHETLQKLSDSVAKNGLPGKIQFAVHFKESNVWRGASATEVGEPISVYDPSDSDINVGHVVDSIQVYLYK